MGHLRKSIGISSQVIQLSKNEFYSQFHFFVEWNIIASIRLYSILTFVLENTGNDYHCVKSVHIRNYSGPYFPVFELKTERDGVSLRIHSEFGKMRTRITPNTDTFHAVHFIHFRGTFFQAHLGLGIIRKQGLPTLSYQFKRLLNVYY